MLFTELNRIFLSLDPGVSCVFFASIHVQFKFIFYFVTRVNINLG